MAASTPFMSKEREGERAGLLRRSCRRFGYPVVCGCEQVISCIHSPQNHNLGDTSNRAYVWLPPSSQGVLASWRAAAVNGSGGEHQFMGNPLTIAYTKTPRGPSVLHLDLRGVDGGRCASTVI
jgi:hypothetical protein